MSRTPHRLLLALGVASALTGCAGLSVPSPSFRAAAADAHRGGRLVVGIPAPASIDPGMAEGSGALVASLVCEPLVQLDPVTGSIAHGLARSVIVDQRGTTITIALQHAKFQDGSDVTAQDVAYALSRVARQDYGSSVAPLLQPVAGYDAIHAAPPPTEDVDPATRRISGITTLSADALVVNLTQPDADFVRTLALPLAAPVPTGLADRDPGFADRPVCAGPYQLGRPYHHGDRDIVLHRFAAYYAADDGYVAGGGGYADEIDFRIEADRAAALADFQAGAVDLAWLDGPVGDLGTLSSALRMAALPEVDFVGLPDGGVFRDPAVRALLSRSLDRTAVVAAVYGGGRLPATRVLPSPLDPGPEPASCAANVPAIATAPRPGDAALSDRLRAGHYTFTVNDDFQNVALARAVAAQWHDRLGIDVDVSPEPWPRYLTEATSPQGFTGIFRESWRAATSSPDSLLDPLFDSRQIGSSDFARYRNVDFDHRLEKVARREVDDRLRRQDYLALEQTLCDDLPLIPVSVPTAKYLVDRRVGAAGGTWFEISSGLPDLRELYLRGATRP